MSPSPKLKRSRILFFLIALCFAVLVFAPLPLQITSKDKECAVSHAIATLFQNHRVLTENGYAHLEDTGFIRDKSRVYFQNDIGIPDTVFLKLGLKAIPQDRKLNVDAGDIIVSFSNHDIEGKLTANMNFSYVFGSLGAQGYEIRIHKSLLLRYFIYVHAWVS
jgi:hypothetical protein